MPILDITYNPYKRKTRVLIDNVDVQTNDEHLTIKEFTNNRVPLQTWIEPIKAKGWGGIVSHLIRKDDAGEIVIRFTGRKLDFEDLKSSLEEQAASRAKDCPVELVFDKNNIKFSLDDHIMMENIEYVKEKMLSDEFKTIMSEVKDKKILDFYESLESNFAQAFDSEFRIVFAGTYSCGKSSIINALIGKTILPMFVETTTTKKCKVIHDSSIGEKMRLVALDSRDGVLVDEIFDNDLDCRNRFEQISPAGQMETNPKGVNEIHIYMDLSHLYPQENCTELSKKFKIVLIDTPGSDSRNSNTMNDDDVIINHDKDVALSAINGQDREIVIICTDAHYQGEPLGELLSEIHRASKDDSGFNDRFLFVMNKSDEILADGLGKHKGLFADSISDSRKWRVRDSYLNPKIFMVSAQTELFVINGLHKLSPEDPMVLSNDKLDEAVSKLNLFYRRGERSEACRPFTECDIPCYKKEQFAIEYNQAVASCNKGRALEIQSGIPCVVTAIQDYISRYAYPIKIQKLLRTFKSLLDVMNNLTIQQSAILADIGNKLGESSLSRKGVEASHAEKEREKEEKEKLKERINTLLDKTAELDSVPKEVDKIRQKFDKVWNSRPIVKKARAVERCATMKRDEYAKVKTELNDLFEDIKREVLNDYTDMRDKERLQFMVISQEIHGIYESIVGTPLEKLAKLSIDCVEGLEDDPMTILNNMLQRTESGKSRETEPISRGARMWRSIVKFFTLGRYGKIDSYDVYPWSHIHEEMNRIEGNFNSQCSIIKNEFTKASEVMKEATQMVLRKIIEGIESARVILSEYEISLDQIKEDEHAFLVEKQRVEKNILLLNDLSNRIELDVEET